MLKKLVVVYDAGVGSFEAVKKEIVEPARKLTRMLVGKFVWQPVGFNENARRLMQFLHDGDLVVVAGGDGLASMAVNAILLSQREVTLAVVGYGLTHDISGLTHVKRPVLYGDEYVGGIEEILRKAEEGKTVEVFPLQIRVNGKPWRYALAHASVGMLAASLQSLDGSGRRHLVGARMKLFGWRMLHKREWRLPEATMRELPVEAKSLDDAREDEATENRQGESATKGAGEVVKEDFREMVGEEKKKDVVVEKGENSVMSRVENLGVDKIEPERQLLSVGKKTMALMAESVVSDREAVVVPEEDVKVVDVVEGLSVARGPAVYEMVILGELSGRDLRISRGVVGIIERIRMLKWKFYNKRHGRAMACAVEATGKPVVLLPEVSKGDGEVDAGRLLGSRVTDLIVVNGLTMGKKWHGGRFYKKPEGFLMKAACLGGVLREFKMSLVSRIWRIPGTKVKGKIELKFLEPQDVYLQTDNAWEELSGVETIEIGKSRRSVKMVK